MMESNVTQRWVALAGLAIEAIITGLLIGGVPKGPRLMGNAKVKTLLSPVRAYEAALNNFKNTCSALPGDTANANLRLAGCGGGGPGNCETRYGACETATRKRKNCVMHFKIEG